MIVLRQRRDASHQAIATRIHNLITPVVRRAPVIMDRCLSSDGPMTAGALRVLGVKRGQGTKVGEFCVRTF